MPNESTPDCARRADQGEAGAHRAGGSAGCGVGRSADRAVRLELGIMQVRELVEHLLRARAQPRQGP